MKSKTEKDIEREEIRAKVRRRISKHKMSIWRLLHKELVAAVERGEKQVDLAARCGVNPAQINKWIAGQGFEDMLVETCLGIQDGLGISLPRLLLAINPNRARAFSAFQKMAIKDMDKIASLNNTQMETLKSIIMGYVDSTVKDPPEISKKKIDSNPLN